MYSYVLSLQKGTVVEKLVEETATDDQHLKHLISICEGKAIRELILSGLALYWYNVLTFKNHLFVSQLKDKWVKLL